MDAIQPSLSSNKRSKIHYRNNPIPKNKGKNLSFWVNQVRLILAALAYNLAHAVRCIIEESTGSGISIKRVQEWYFRVASRFVIHARRLIVVVKEQARNSWDKLWGAMRQLDYVRILS